MSVEIGSVAPTFTLPVAGGGEASLRAEDAKATVVAFTCNHCPYALAWHDRINDVARDYADRGVAVLQINANDAVKYPLDSFETMEERVRDGQFAGPYLHDESQEVAREWGAKVTPDVFVLDGSGVVRYRGAPDADYGDESLNAAYLRAALDDVLGDRTVELAETEPQGCGIKWK